MNFLLFFAFFQFFCSEIVNFSKYYFRHLFIFGDCQKTGKNKKLIFGGWLVAAENKTLFSAIFSGDQIPSKISLRPPKIV
jgi:hypothetical protein